MADLKTQHIIVMASLLVALVGTLLILGNMHTNATPITGATAVVDIAVENNAVTDDTEEEHGVVVRVAGNQTEK